MAPAGPEMFLCLVCVFLMALTCSGGPRILGGSPGMQHTRADNEHTPRQAREHTHTHTRTFIKETPEVLQLGG